MIEVVDKSVVKRVATQMGWTPPGRGPTNEQIVALADRGEHLTPSPTKYPELGHGTQYSCGEPGLLGFSRALLDFMTLVPDAPTEEQAQEMGENGAPHSERERQLYEAYCKGHCWKVGPWDVELGCYVDMTDRIRFAMWRDRAALGSDSIFQSRVVPWLKVCFGVKIMADKMERNQRFFEEATELVQANGMSQEDCHKLVDYVYGRPIGELHQEVGGVMVTLAALCNASKIDMHEAGDTELARVWTKIEQIRAKQAAKPKGSPLPQTDDSVSEADRLDWLMMQCNVDDMGIDMPYSIERPEYLQRFRQAIDERVRAERSKV
ncbi:hypothetical protein [Cupriavidus campinensis]|uniref:hypothetical protein n=1 Tax=Cupriavidus campinensis TaxID=151783 RepID=UPI001C8FC104|nr:hypothetical protein [Cupriavidus campinensis]